MNSADALERGRRAYARRAWGEAWESLSLADRTAPLGAEDVELLGTSAYMLGRPDDLESLERAYHLYLDAGEALRAARCAFWKGMALSIRGEVSRATGWLGARAAVGGARAARLRGAGLSAAAAHLSARVRR